MVAQHCPDKASPQGFTRGGRGCKTHPILCQVLSNPFRHAIPNRKDLWKASERRVMLQVSKLTTLQHTLTQGDDE